MTPKTKNKPITADFSRDRLLSLGSILYNAVTICRTGKIPLKKRPIMAACIVLNSELIN